MTEQYNEHEHHHHEGDCGCGCGCGTHHHHHHHGEEGGGCHCTDKFLELADEAWAEVLKEKIKSQIIAHKSEHLDKLAELVAKANGEKWKYKISAKMKGSEFKDDLKDFFSSCDK